MRKLYSADHGFYQGNGGDRHREIREAIAAGQRALSSLDRAREYLDSARGWGIFDMLGGGLISSFIKHSKIEDASDCLEEAKQDLRAFSRELADVQSVEGIDVGIDSFLTFADFFLDGFLADYFVQRKIREAQSEVDSAIRQVEDMVVRLQRSL